jgi:hypothetical protein
MKEFFLCHNPLLVFKEGMTGYVFHAGKPRFLAAFFTIDPVKEFYHLDYLGPNLIFVYTRGDGSTQLFLLVVTQNIDRAITKLDTALQQAASWHATCLDVEDQKKYGKKSSYHFLTDLNLITPGLKILHLPGVDKYILSYPQGVKSFDSLKAMDKFMTSLGYNDLQLEGGHQNVYAPGAKGR